MLLLVAKSVCMLLLFDTICEGDLHLINSHCFRMSRRACPDPNVAIGFILPSGELLEEEIPDSLESVSFEFFTESDKNANVMGFILS
uniref:Uncharacterized protein n=1 Tax=Parascaris equorum TaxID=6256 RepID=A0A914RIT0_PAREQ